MQIFSYFFLYNQAGNKTEEGSFIYFISPLFFPPPVFSCMKVSHLNSVILAFKVGNI